MPPCPHAFALALTARITDRGRRRVGFQHPQRADGPALHLEAPDWLGPARARGSRQAGLIRQTPGANGSTPQSGPGAQGASSERCQERAGAPDDAGDLTRAPPARRRVHPTVKAAPHVVPSAKSLPQLCAAHARSSATTPSLRAAKDLCRQRSNKEGPCTDGPEPRLYLRPGSDLT
jgi:hypothetical protein